MSDRELCILAQRQLYAVFTIGMLLVAGCEQTGIVPQPDIETAAVADSKSAGEPLLLLEDEPEDDALSESAADNSRCFVCHMNYTQEEIAVTHARAGIGCAQCHGQSDAHIADESWASGGNGTAPDLMYLRDKINPSCMACHTREKIDTPQHGAIFTESPGMKVCTDCHGNHRLPQRRCKWR